jgi:hypothetical protein
VSAPLRWEEVPDCEPGDFTPVTMPNRLADLGDPHAAIDDAPGSLERLLELAGSGRGSDSRVASARVDFERQAGALAPRA